MHTVTSRVILKSLWNFFGNTAADPDNNFIFGVLFIKLFFPMTNLDSFNTQTDERINLTSVTPNLSILFFSNCQLLT